MATITKNLTVDISRANLFPPLAVKQNDKNSRYLNITLENIGESVLLDATDTIKLVAKLPDGTSVSSGGTLKSDGTINVLISNEMLQQVGTVYCEILIKNGNARLSSALFRLEVEESR